MTAYHALAQSDRNQLVKSAFPGMGSFTGGGVSGAFNRLRNGGDQQPPQRNYFQRKFLDPAWNAAKPGVQQAVDSAWNAGRDGLKSMASDARNAVDHGIDKSLNFVNDNISKPMYGAAQAVQNGAKSMYAGAQNAVDHGIDRSLDFVNRNISAPMYGAMAGAQQGWQNANTPPGAPAQMAGHMPPRAEPLQQAPMPQAPMPQAPIPQQAPVAAPQMMAGQPPAPPMDYNAQFRQQHGTAFDPNSSVDRAKMQQMQGGYASR